MQARVLGSQRDRGASVAVWQEAVSPGWPGDWWLPTMQALCAFRAGVDLAWTRALQAVTAAGRVVVITLPGVHYFDPDTGDRMVVGPFGAAMAALGPCMQAAAALRGLPMATPAPAPPPPPVWDWKKAVADMPLPKKKPAPAEGAPSTQPTVHVPTDTRTQVVATATTRTPPLPLIPVTEEQHTPPRKSVSVPTVGPVPAPVPAPVPMPVLVKHGHFNGLEPKVHIRALAPSLGRPGTPQVPKWPITPRGVPFC
jgi:hypothetical protein